jgi:tRNA 2-thiouridine synthesizing protein E
MAMATTVTFGGKPYQVDSEGFLVDWNAWDEGYANGMAEKDEIRGGLTEKHWEVLRFIRESFQQTGRCPLVYETCRAHKLGLRGLQALFPRGYLRGACKLAGLTYREGYVKYSWVEAVDAEAKRAAREKVYRTDVRGFLVDPDDWDEQYAAHRAQDSRMYGGLSERHWQVLRFLRRQFAESGRVPSVYETCEANGLEMDDLERLFPDGYNRGAVRLAGLRVR